MDDNIPVFISVRPLRASLALSREADSQDVERSISLKVKLDDCEVRTTEGRSLRDVEWIVYFSRAETYNEAATAAGAMGFLVHHEALSSFDIHTPESCHILAALKPDMFDLLLATLQAGRLPDNIMLRVKDLSYGDGSVVEWDTTKNKGAPVVYISVGLPLAALPTYAGDLLEEVPSNLPITPADLKAVESAMLEAVKSLQRQLLAKLQWVIALLAVLTLVALFR